MIHDDGKTQPPPRTGEDLEPYRRMIDMQKQIIEMVKRHEQSKRECEQLRQQVAREIATFCSPRPALPERIRDLTLRLSRPLLQSGSRVKRAIETVVNPSSTPPPPKLD